MSALALVHVCGATVGLISGFLSAALRKGGSMHRIAGNIFFAAMLCMAGSGAYMAVFVKPNDGNVVGGVLTLYLVSTGWVAGRRREQSAGAFDVVAFAVIALVAAAGVTWGIQAKLSPKGLHDGYPATMFFIFASIALLFAASDLRLMLRGGVSGARRIARHLWRMSLALLFATLSLYPGNRTRLFSGVPQTGLLYLPHILLIASTLFWMIRLRIRRRPAAVTAIPIESPAESRAA